MKIQILTDIKDSIDGFNPVFLNENGLSANIAENSATEIIMNGTVELVPYEKLDNILLDLKKLVRKGGKIVMNGVDASCVSRDFVTGIIDIKTYNDVIFSRMSVHDSKQLGNKLKSLGFVIDKILLRGSIYELHASRPQ
jgi:hypothetical protein